MAGNNNLNKAKSAKKDEFYTQLSDIENELKHYKEHFKGKTVLCNCDDPRISNFFHYFSYNFEFLGLRKLITTCYKNQNMDLFSRNDCESAIWLEYFGDRDGDRVPSPEEIGVHRLNGDGDFRSDECIELLREADIVVTNPPFSLFREYVAQLIEHEKKFIIVGNQNALKYKEIFPLIKENRLWLGMEYGNMKFIVPDEYEMRNTRSWRDADGNNWRSLGNSCWFTNIDNKRRSLPIALWQKYDPDNYPVYDDFDAINVDFVNGIPCDYYGAMGVPITFLYQYNPNQFEIIGELNHGCDNEYDLGKPTVNGEQKYVRILIKRIKQD